MRKLSAKGVSKCLNSDEKRQRCIHVGNFWNLFGAIQMISSRARLVTRDETWLSQYGPETKQQSMEWWHSGSPPPKNSECKNPLESFSSRFLGSKRHPPHCLSYKGSNNHRGELLISTGAIEGYFGETARGKFTKVLLFLHDNAPAHRALATQKKLAYMGFQCLDHPITHPTLRIWPLRTTTCSLD